MFFGDAGDLQHAVQVHDGAGGVVGEADQQQLGARGDGRPDRFGADGEMVAGIGRQIDDGAARQEDAGGVADKTGLGDDYLISRVQERLHGQVHRLADPYSDQEFMFYIVGRSTVEALEHLHRQRVVHLDLKPANLFLKQTAEVAFLDFGRMDAYDAGGNPEGKVQANETAITVGLGKEVKPRISVGANLKFIYSILGQYISTGAAVDLGATWTSKDSLLTVGAAMRNMGFQLLTYTDGNREPLPFTLEAGINFKPRHMPFRFNIVAHSLQRFDITYNQYLRSNTIDLSGQQVNAPEATFGEKVMRHFTFGTELVLGKNFGIMGGYSHQRRREMAPDARPGVAGFSWGMHFRISKVQIAYSSQAWFPGFNANLFTFTSLISDFKRKPATSRS